MSRDLNDIQIFLKVVEKGSFTEAAKSLGGITSSMSRKVARLEENIGVKLLNRTTRKISLTDVGQIYHEKCLRFFSQLQETEDQIADLISTPRGKIRLLAPAEHTMTTSLVLSFLKKYPDIVVETTLTDKTINMVEEGYDVAIHVGPVTSLSLIAHRIFESHFQLVASKEYVETNGEPKSISDLSKHDCVIFGSSCTNAHWDLSSSGILKPVPVSGKLAVNHLNAVLCAVEEGHGIALLPQVAVGEGIRSGALIEVLGKVKKPIIDISIVWASGKFQVPSVRAFIEHTKAEFGIIGDGLV